MPVISPFQVAAYAKAAGWPNEEIAWVVAAAFAESGWNTEAIGSDGHDFGLMQTRDNNASYAPANYFPPGTLWKQPFFNLQVARKIYLAQGRGAWAVDKTSQWNKDGGKAMASQAQVAASAAAQVAGLQVDNTVQGQSNQQKILEQLEAATGIVAGGFGLNPGGSTDINIDPQSGSINTTTSAPVLDFVTDPMGWLTKNIGSALWIGGGSVLVVLGLVMMAKDMSPVGAITKVIGK